ncbi:hypothetical protein RHGRI_015939 [Rhododendron griersonianum]|uniref:Uncharacterized protein n=1 Tax=Rhododendron griersonianum TaxID=479676 RepID=A0AAV6JSA2_9ERIC|nr:hypothetical protein RHGRI_015939 [Rhododendron griersonianum]
MSCFCGERRGPEWKQSWGERTLASTFETPIPSLVLFGVTLLIVLSTSSYLEGKAKVEQTMFDNFQLFLILWVVIFTLLFHVVNIIRDPRPVCDAQRWRDCADGSPWMVATVVVFLLVMVSFQSSIQSKLFKLL